MSLSALLLKLVLHCQDHGLHIISYFYVMSAGFPHYPELRAHPFTLFLVCAPRLFIYL